jgi:hypothetical protein
MDTTDFADACQSLAENLDEEQAALHYEGAQAITLGKLSSNLSAQASTLRTLVVANALVGNDDAMKALNDGTAATKNAAESLKVADKAIQISGLVLSLGAAIISMNPTAVINASNSLITVVSA